jgi:hypothetical protein
MSQIGRSVSSYALRDRHTRRTEKNESPISFMKRIVIYRHPDCEKCAQIARVHHAFDWFNRVGDVTIAPKTGPLRMGEVIVEDVTTDSLLPGVEGLELICRQIPMYWPMLPLLRIPAVRARIDREMGGCTNGSCQIGSHFGGNPRPATRS